MLLVVAEAINKGIPNLTRVRQIATMVAIAPHAPASSPERGIEEPVRAHREALHPTRERIGIVRLDDEMQVIVLDRELHDAKVLAPGPANRALERGIERLRPE